jgi:predicted O-methyltransferase YrrM
VANPAARDEDTEIMRAFNRKLYEDPRVAISMATMGDGLMLACKL